MFLLCRVLYVCSSSAEVNDFENDDVICCCVFSSQLCGLRLSQLFPASGEAAALRSVQVCAVL